MRFLWLPALLLLSPGCAPNDQNDHSAGKDPDLVPTDTIANIPHEIHVGEPLIEQPPEPPNTLVHLDTARQYVGVTEQPKDSNRGPEVERFLAAVDLKPSQNASGEWRSFPYCAAFVSFCLNAAGQNLTFPATRTALAMNFIHSSRSIRASVVQRGTVTIEPGTIVIWKAKRDPQDTSGHVGLVVEWEGQAGTTIEGNTSSGDEGSQREGGGVYQRKRILSPGSAFRIVSFTPVEYQ